MRRISKGWIYLSIIAFFFAFCLLAFHDHEDHQNHSDCMVCHFVETLHEATSTSPLASSIVVTSICFGLVLVLKPYSFCLYPLYGESLIHLKIRLNA